MDENIPLTVDLPAEELNLLSAKIRLPPCAHSLRAKNAKSTSRMSSSRPLRWSQKLSSEGTCSRFTPFNASPAIIISRTVPIPRLKSIHAFTTSANLVSGSR